MCDLYFVHTFYDVDLAGFDLNVIQQWMCMIQERLIQTELAEVTLKCMTLRK